MLPAVDRRLLLSAFIAFVLSQPAFASTPVVQLVDKKTLGGYIEDIEIVRTGPLAGQLVAVMSGGLYAVRIDRPNDTPRKLADLRHLPLLTISPRGVAWVESEQDFALIQTGQLESLVFTDAAGNDLGSRAIRYLNGYVPTHAEGLAYIPRGAPMYADDLVTVAWDAPLGTTSRLEVMQRDGQVVAEIFPSLGDGVMTSVAYGTAGHLLVGFERNDVFENDLYEIDFDGNVTGGPIPMPDFIEGLARSSDGRIWATHFDHVEAFDRAFNPLPSDEKDFGIGLRLAVPLGVAWSGDLGQHLVNVWRGGAVSTGDSAGSPARDIAAVPATADSYSILASPGTDAAHLIPMPRALSYMADGPDGPRVVVASRGAVRGLILYDLNGAFVEQVNLPGRESPTSPPLGQPTSVEYIPTMNQFAVRFSRNNVPSSHIVFFNRNGSFNHDIDLAPLGVTSIGSFAFFNPGDPSGGELLVFAMGHRGLVIDLNGALRGEFDFRAALDTLAVSDIAAVSTGPDGGTFSAVDTETGELVTFTVDVP